MGIQGLLVRDFPPTKSQCCVLEQETLSAAYNGSTQEDPSQHDRIIVDWDVKNQNNQTNKQNWSGCEIYVILN